MSHFAAGYMVAGYGKGASLSKSSFTTPTTSGTNSVEGQGQLTADLSATDLGAGLYEINVTIVQRTASDAATTDVIEPVLTYTHDQGAQSAASIRMPATGTADHKGLTAGVATFWAAVVRVASGNIVVQLKDTVTGAKTVGAVDWYVTIQKLA